MIECRTHDLSIRKGMTMTKHPGEAKAQEFLTEEINSDLPKWEVKNRRPLIRLNREGGIDFTSGTVRTILRHDPKFSGCFRFDEETGMVWIMKTLPVPEGMIYPDGTPMEAEPIPDPEIGRPVVMTDLAIAYGILSQWGVEKGVFDFIFILGENATRTTDA